MNERTPHGHNTRRKENGKTEKQKQLQPGGEKGLAHAQSQEGRTSSVAQQKPASFAFAFEVASAAAIAARQKPVFVARPPLSILF